MSECGARDSVVCISLASRPSEDSSGCLGCGGTGIRRACAPDRAGSAAAGQRRPQRRRGVREPEVNVAVLGERGQHPELPGRQRGRPEQREPFRQRGFRRIGAEVVQQWRRAAARGPCRRSARAAGATTPAARPRRSVPDHPSRPRPDPAPRRSACPDGGWRSRRTARPAGGRPRTGGRAGARRPGRCPDSPGERPASGTRVRWPSSR